MNYDELIPGCSLHHLNLSGIDISLLNNKASKQVLPVHSTWTANPLEVSNLRFKCCARVRGENDIISGHHGDVKQSRQLCSVR